MFSLCRSLISGLVLAATLGAAYAAPVAVDTPLPLETAVDIVGLEAYGSIASISPDGSLAAYTVSVNHVHEMHLLPLNGGKGSRLTTSKEDAHSPVWSPDGQALAFFNRSVEQPGNEFHLWLYQAGKLKQISGVPVATRPPWLRPQWTKDGQSIVVAIATPDATAELEPKVEQKYAAIEVFRAFREGYPDRLPSTISPPSEGVGIIDVRTGTLRKLASGLVYGYQMDPSGTKLAIIIRPPRTDTDVMSAHDELRIIDLKTGETKTLFNAVSSSTASISWSTDGKYLGWAQDYPPDVGTAYLVSVDDGEVRKIKAEPQAVFAADAYGARPILWDMSSRRFFAIADRQLWVGTAEEGIARPVTKSGEWKIGALVPGAALGTAASDDDYQSVIVSVFHGETLEQGFARVDLASGELTVLIKTDGHFAEVTNTPVVLPDQRLLYHAEDAHQAGALWLSTFDFQSPRRLAVLNPQLEGRAYGASRLLTWKNSRGDVLQGSVLMPSDYVVGRRYPVKLNVYAEAGAGFRKGVFGSSDGVNGQVFATRGYIVFTPDTRLRIGSPAADLIDDVGTGIDALIRTGFVDESRFACSGESYGGYNVMILVTSGIRCRAVVSRSGFSDILTAAYGNPGKGSMSAAWAENWQGRMGGSPWQSPEVKQRYIDNSPFWKLDAIQNAPVLLLHGLKDDTVPSHASILTFYGIKRVHKPVEAVFFRDENHGFQQRQNRIDVLERELAWDDEYMDISRDEVGRLLFEGDRPRSRKLPSLAGNASAGAGGD